MQITYLVANYNNGRYIDDCLRSLQAQTNPAWHCLIGDDKSTDDSVAQIRPWLSNKIELCCNEINLGYTATLIRLIEQASTDIVGILDPDDALQPETTELLLQAYQSQPAVGLVYTNFTIYDETLQTVIAPGQSRAILTGSTSLETGYVSHLKTFRRSAYWQTAGYDIRLPYAEDRDLVYKLEEVTTVHFIDRELYKYRQVRHSQSNAPEKRQLGIANHRRAYEAALQRRGIHGLRKWLYRMHFQERYTGRRLTPVALTASGRALWRMLIGVSSSNNMNR